ncbi:MAG: hypothetical protein ACK55I_23880, partial [bacterium]
GVLAGRAALGAVELVAAVLRELLRPLVLYRLPRAGRVGLPGGCVGQLGAELVQQLAQLGRTRLVGLLALLAQPPRQTLRQKRATRRPVQRHLPHRDNHEAAVAPVRSGGHCAAGDLVGGGH